MTDGDSLTFEDALAQLNQIVERLETGELSLDETLALYEQGQELAKFCEDALTQAQQDIPGISLLLPDALGHPIVLKPEGELDAGMIERALEHPSMPDWVTPSVMITRRSPPRAENSL